MALIPIALPCPRAPAAPRRAVPGSPVQRRGLRGAFAGLALTAAKVARAKAVPEKFPEAVEVEASGAKCRPWMGDDGYDGYDGSLVDVGNFCYIESPYEMGRIAERQRVSQAHDRQFGTV